MNRKQYSKNHVQYLMHIRAFKISDNNGYRHISLVYNIIARTSRFNMKIEVVNTVPTQKWGAFRIIPIKHPEAVATMGTVKTHPLKIQRIARQLVARQSPLQSATPIVEPMMHIVVWRISGLEGCQEYIRPKKTYRDWKTILGCENHGDRSTKFHGESS